MGADAGDGDGRIDRTDTRRQQAGEKRPPEAAGIHPAADDQMPACRHPAFEGIGLRFGQGVQWGIASQENGVHAAVARRFIRQIARTRLCHLRGRRSGCGTLPPNVRPIRRLKGNAALRMSQTQFLTAEKSERAGVAAKADEKQIAVPHRRAGDGGRVVGDDVGGLRQNAPIAALPVIRDLDDHTVASRINAARVDDKCLRAAPIDRNGPGEERRGQRLIAALPAIIGMAWFIGRQHLSLTGQRIRPGILDRDRDRTPGSGPVMPRNAENSGERRTIGTRHPQPRPDREKADGPQRENADRPSRLSSHSCLIFWEADQRPPSAVSISKSAMSKLAYTFCTSSLSSSMSISRST